MQHQFHRWYQTETGGKNRGRTLVLTTPPISSCGGAGSPLSVKIRSYCRFCISNHRRSICYGILYLSCYAVDIQGIKIRQIKTPGA
ncbi:MAG: hypothetical protein R2942_18005 [Ignavibacteria bacterium]